MAVERGILPRGAAITRTLSTLRFFHASPQGPEPDVTGYKGFYYHFLDMKTGRRAWSSELSTIDTALFIAGVLSAGLYFDGLGDDEREIRALADALYRRIDWVWALRGGASLSHGWKPESGFLGCSWDRGYSEAMILYVLALGSPTFPIPEDGYRAWTSTFERRTAYGCQYLYAGPLFIHQLSHVWLDFRGIRDDENREVDLRLLREQPARDARAQAVRHREPPRLRALLRERVGADGEQRARPGRPGDLRRPARVLRLPGQGGALRARRRDNLALGRGGLPALRARDRVRRRFATRSSGSLARSKHGCGFDASYNRTFPARDGSAKGWVSPWRLGLNEGPIVLMIENHLSGLMWRLFRRSPYVVTGLRRAGFTGGWLAGDRSPRQTRP